jgi:hypothetical protein
MLFVCPQNKHFRTTLPKSPAPSEEKNMIFGRQTEYHGYRLRKTEKISDGKFIYQYSSEKRNEKFRRFDQKISSV